MVADLDRAGVCLSESVFYCTVPYVDSDTLHYVFHCVVLYAYSHTLQTTNVMYTAASLEAADLDRAGVCRVSESCGCVLLHGTVCIF